MSDPNASIAPVAPVDPGDHDTGTTAGLWSGDVGTLSEQSRRALLELIKGPYLSGRRRPQLWAALMADQAAIRSRLHDLFLDLVIEPVDEFAFTRKVRTTEIDAPSPLRTEKLTFLDSAMLLVLRRHLLAAPGETRVIVGRDEVYEELAVYRSGDESTFRRNLNGAWGRALNKFRVLHAVDEDRAEISPVLRFVLDHHLVETLTREYEAIAAGTAFVGADDATETGHEEDDA